MDKFKSIIVKARRSRMGTKISEEDGVSSEDRHDTTTTVPPKRGKFSFNANLLFTYSHNIVTQYTQFKS